MIPKTATYKLIDELRVRILAKQGVISSLIAYIETADITAENASLIRESVVTERSEIMEYERIIIMLNETNAG